MLVVVLAALAVVARLYEVQVVQHELWADEARRLEREGSVLPYRRGAILDAHGTPLVEDVGDYGLELSYRDFRRGHPLGQVAHARSTLLQEPVSLEAALEGLDAWGAELVTLSPGELYDFARGAPIERTGFAVPQARTPFGEQRPARAADLRYYVSGLLEASDEEKKQLRRLERRRESRASYLEYVADMRRVDPDELLRERRVAWAASVERLAVLAERLEWDVGGRRIRSRIAAFQALVADLERWRRSIEDATASALFRELFEFHPGRIEPDLLVGAFDLEWLRVQLGWNEPRVRLWAAQARADFLETWRGTYALPRLLARLEVAGRDVTPDFTLSTMLAVLAPQADFVAALDGRPVPWRAVERLAVIDELEGVLALQGRPEPRVAVELPPLDPAVRATLSGGATWRTLVEWTAPQRVAALSRVFASELGPAWSARRTSADPEAYRDRLAYEGDLARVWSDDAHRSQAQRADRARRAALALLDTFEEEFQVALARRVEELRALSPRGVLELSQERGDRLGERARHVLKDWSSRPVSLYDEPDHEVV
jgi:hypothetical protein